MGRSISIIRYPIETESGERPLLAVWLALALSLLVPILPVLPVIGYLTRTLAASEQGDPFPPFFEDGWLLVRRSVGGTFLTVLFLGPPFVAMLVTIYGVLFGTASAGDVPTARILAGSTAVLFAGVLALYLLPIALTAYGRDGSLRGALSLGTLREIATHGAYFFGWTQGCVALALVAAAGTALAAIPRIGPVLSALALAYGLLATTALWGRGIGRARRRG